MTGRGSATNSASEALAESHPDTVRNRIKADWLAGLSPFRLLALGCALVLIGAYVKILRDLTLIVGGTEQLTTIVLVALGAGLVAAPLLSERVAVPIGGVAAVAGLLLYFSVAGIDPGMLVPMLDTLLADFLTLADGMELMRVMEAQTLAIAYAPAPAFLTWYLALRGRYGAAVVPAGLALVFLVLTGDAMMTPTLVGALAGTGVVAFGELARRDAGFESVDVLTVVLVTMIVCSLFVPFVPGGSNGSSLIHGIGAGTLEGSIAGSPDRSAIGGSVELSPEVRFTIESEVPSYWRTAVYNRFTGDEWVRTGEMRPYEEPLDPPPASGTSRVTQTVTVESPVEVMPTAAAPLSVEGDMAAYTEVSDQGQLYPSVTLREDDRYTVESAIVDPSSRSLARAGTDYPDSIERRYLQQPDSQSGAFSDRVDAVVEGAKTPFEKAQLIESHLRNSKSYSLSVDRPDGDAASAFLLEMDEGYCVHFATTMVMMLREEGIPARYATGYTEGQQVRSDSWVVRGTDAHAWPEVYFPEVGWVTFEPTPAGERDDVHQDRVDQARQNGNPNVDTDESEPDDPDPDEQDPGSDDPDEQDPGADDPDEQDPANESPPSEPDTNSSDTGTTTGGGGSGGDSGGSIPVPSRDQLILGGLIAVGLAAAAHRTGVDRALVRTARLYWQRPTGDPTTDAERAFRRLEILLGRRYRSRRPAESPRAYLAALDSEAALDDRVYDVAIARERATYGSGVDPAAATDARKAVDELVRRYGPIGGRDE
ncbi:transglutaminase [Halovivax asiaticus JCM 14624]|uniref:Transglutaminase n=1 Tax=Halovivax asiaticus JCM 14624 TaxID=1227490 RepID=M0BI35_9EURY|nr:DUF3488 and transglutaminase-like domain-containing protein [Halovivax asiaticus]ELZ09319.1 transglutaminase [Halovivax asiaticus JCM 14624]